MKGPRYILKHLWVLLRARRNEKKLKVKPVTSFKYFQYLLTKHLEIVIDRENII